jgi:hypothetical protein
VNDTISFQSRGLIDPRCITTIGVSVKETENPIGFFGTGLKYAIAIILRAKGEITIWRGLEPMRFTTHAIEVRGKSVDLVCMNGHELGFTVELGKHWEMWQAFREIYCNTLDEGGECNFGMAAPTEGTTTVCVSLRAFAECFSNIEDYILKTEAIYPGPVVAFHPGPSAAVFYRTIRVHGALTDKPCFFAPNVLERIDLTEDRTAKDQWELYRRIAKAILQSKDRRFLERWLTVKPDYAEHGLDLDWPSLQPSDEFLAVAGDVARDASRSLNPSALKVLTRCTVPPAPVEADLMPSEAASLAEAVAFCHALKYPVDEFKINVVESLGLGILGKADPEARQIMLARRAIQMGDLTCAATLIEEWAHIKHGVKDCSREMQNWLFEQLTRIGDAYLYEIGHHDAPNGEREATCSAN